MIQLHCENKSTLPFHQNGLLHWFPHMIFWQDFSGGIKPYRVLWNVGWDIVIKLGDIDASDWF